MDPEQTCANHLERKALSFCHHCGGYYCHECLEEGGEYYYCRRRDCQKVLQEEKNALSKKEQSEKSSEYFYQDFVQIGSFPSSFEANLAKSRLESEGIECFISDENISKVLGSGLVDGIFGGVKLWVKCLDKEKALSIFKNL